MQSAERRSERRVRTRQVRVSVRGADRVLVRGKSTPYMYTAFHLLVNLQDLTFAKAR